MLHRLTSLFSLPGKGAARTRRKYRSFDPSSEPRRKTRTHHPFSLVFVSLCFHGGGPLPPPRPRPLCPRGRLNTHGFEVSFWGSVFRFSYSLFRSLASLNNFEPFMIPYSALSVVSIYGALSLFRSTDSLFRRQASLNSFEPPMSRTEFTRYGSRVVSRVRLLVQWLLLTDECLILVDVYTIFLGLHGFYFDQLSIYTFMYRCDLVK